METSETPGKGEEGRDWPPGCMFAMKPSKRNKLLFGVGMDVSGWKPRFWIQEKTEEEANWIQRKEREKEPGR